MAQLILVTSRCWMQKNKVHQRRWNGSKESRDRNCHGISTGSLSLAMCGPPLCFSVNIRKQLNGWVTCELNNSSKTADPQDLVPSIGSQYHQMKVSRENPVLQSCQYQQSFCLAIHTLWKKNHGTSTRRLTGFIYEVSKTGYIFSLQVFRNISLPLKHARLPFLAVLECLSELIKPFNSQR